MDKRDAACKENEAKVNAEKNSMFAVPITTVDDRGDSGRSKLYMPL